LSKEIGVTVKKEEDYSEWYTQVVLKSELVDYASAKGFMVLRPYGYVIWENIQGILDKAFKRLGHQNAYFPSLIPESLLRKEAKHFSGFIPEVFWVNEAGNNKIGERLAARPTSEAIAYYSYAKWVRSWRDLPLLLNCWNSVLRAEIKSTKPFIRTSEFLWQEGHTVHESKEDAASEVMTILRLYKDFIEETLAIPVVVGSKSDREKFVGALYTMSLESMMPDGKALQMGTSHHLGQNFSKAFGITFLGKDKQNHFAWQTSWGVSWRLIGATIMVHGDSKGLVIPPKIAPIQIVVIPIVFKKESSAQVLERASLFYKTLTDAGFKAVYDDRDGYTPGWKFHEWELKGVPIRLELGPRDISQSQITLVSRDDGEKTVIGEELLVDRVTSMLDEIQSRLKAKAKKMSEAYTSEADSYESLKQIIKTKGGFVKSPWCGDQKCEDKIKDETGADIRVLQVNSEEKSPSCVYCGQPSNQIAYFGKAY